MYKIILVLSGFLASGLQAAAMAVDYPKQAVQKMAELKSLLTEPEQKAFALWIAEYWQQLVGKQIEAGVLGATKKDGKTSLALYDGTVLSLKQSPVGSIYKREVSDVKSLDDPFLIVQWGLKGYGDKRKLSGEQQKAIDAVRLKMRMNGDPVTQLK